LDYLFIATISRQKLALIDEPNQILKLDKQNYSDITRDPVNTEYETLLMIKSEKLYLFALTNQII
jgi:hypothetical protein